MISMRSGSGLGDSLYLQSIARHLAGKDHAIEVCSDWPDVFRPLAATVRVSPFRRDRITRLAHYSTRRAAAGTDQFEDCCLSAGITGPVDLRLDWKTVNAGLVSRLRRDGRPIVTVQLPRAPMGRTDGFGAELLPDCAVIQRIIDRIGRRALVVQIGAGKPLHRFDGVDLDLANATSVADLLDVAAVAGGFVGYCSFIVPLAESFARPALLVWSRAGLQSPHEVIRQMTPAKVLHRKTSRYAVDDCSEAELAGSVDAFLEQVGSPALV